MYRKSARNKYFRFTEDGITNEIVTSRRISSYFFPIPKPKKKGKQLSFETEWTEDRIEENKLINRIRESVAKWRKGGYTGITKTSERLLDHWKSGDRERKLFFCQVAGGDG
jgi:type III restriction enzyme